MTFIPDESQLNALRTWYSKDNPLHFEPRHAVIKLAGEAGEILDLYGKHEYKPNFSWWNCKHCGYDKASHGDALYCPIASFEPIFYTPLILDELGDYSYYLRILAYQKELTFEESYNLYQDVNHKLFYSNDDLLELLSDLNMASGEVLSRYLQANNVWSGRLADCVLYFMATLDNLDITLQQVLDLNYKKLNSDPTNHGWRNATIKTIDDCPPMSEFY